MLFRRVEKLVIKVVTFPYWVYKVIQLYLNIKAVIFLHFRIWHLSGNTRKYNYFNVPSLQEQTESLGSQLEYKYNYAHFIIPCQNPVHLYTRFW